ncbi:MAG: transporter substrate-binding domain-containing protein [Alphaproteobacteria bacterium]
MKKHTGHIALVIALVALALTFVNPKKTVHEIQNDVTKAETAFERIMRTNTIRCGYYISPALVMRDPNTGAMSGAIVDYVNALGEALKLNVVWQEEINLGTYLEDLKSGKYDVECSGGWPNALRGKQADYSTPIYYFPFYAAVRADDHRFDNNYEAMNVPEVKIAGQDGGTNALIRIKRFPKATADDLPGLAPAADTLMEVVNNKADVTFADHATIVAFSKSNPGKIRKLEGAPVRIIPTNLSFAPGEFRLQQMINTATHELIFDGVIDRILDKYEPEPGAFLRVAPPYAISEKPKAP